MKKLISVLLAGLLVAAMGGCSGADGSTASAGEKLQVGVVQIMEHTSLDEYFNIYAKTKECKHAKQKPVAESNLHLLDNKTQLIFSRQILIHKHADCNSK